MISGLGRQVAVVLAVMLSACLVVSASASAQDNRGVQVSPANPAGTKPNTASDEQRVALVIGNGAYRSVPHLANPPNDARAIADVLRGAGFDLVGGKALVDLDRPGTEQAIRSFGQKLRGGTIGLFYYAGHGVQINGANYLVPVSANLTTEADVKYELVDVNYVLDEMVQAGNRLNVVILDACRNNPFGGRGLRAVSSGLAQMQAPSGTVISYATQPGNVAADGADGHSPFTEALATSIREPGRTVFDVFNDVGVTVKKKTGGIQQPWLATSPIEGQFYFVAPPAAVAEPARPLAAPPPYIVTGTDKEALYWESIRDSNNSAFYQAYLDQFPSGVFAGLARAKLATLPRRDVSPPPQPAVQSGTKAALTDQPKLGRMQRALDPASVPFLSEAQKAGLGDYLAAVSPKMLAIGSAGHLAWVSSKGNRDVTREDMRRRTLERCQFSNGAPCVLYSVDGFLVDDSGAIPPPTPVSLRVSGIFEPEAVPFVSQAVRDTKMKEYAGAAAHKALAIHPGGAWSYVSGRSTAEEAKKAALENCSKFRDHGCAIYAADDKIVFDHHEVTDDSLGAGAKGDHAKVWLHEGK